MRDESKQDHFTILAIIGLIVLFFSLFLDWYSFQIVNNDGDLVVQWNYNLLTGWATMLDSDVNIMFRPADIALPVIIPIVFMGLIMLTGYLLIVRPLDQAPPEQLEAQKYGVYGMLLLLIFSGFFIVIFPIMYLLPEGLYFPFIIFSETDWEVTYHYSMGVGYWVHVIGFVLVFPKCIFDYQTLQSFKGEDDSPEAWAHDLLAQHTDAIDFDKLISEEQLKTRLEAPSLKKTVLYTEKYTEEY